MQTNKSMLKDANELMLSMLKDATFVDNQAKLLRKMYIALLDVGFTDDEAVHIVANQSNGG